MEGTFIFLFSRLITDQQSIKLHVNIVFHSRCPSGGGEKPESGLWQVVYKERLLTLLRVGRSCVSILM